MMCTNIASYYGQDIKEEGRVRPVTNGLIEKSRREKGTEVLLVVRV